jgi:RecA-family ATPase
MADRHSSRGGDFAIEPLDLVDPVSLFGIDPPERRWLWESWIPDRAVTVISGDGGTGKSLLALQLATACATGRLFLGNTVKRCNVLVVACEDEKDELHRRQDCINREHDLSLADLEGMTWLPRAGMENVMMLFNADGTGAKTPFFDQVISAAKSLGAGLVVLDTAADLFGGNENIRPQVRQFINALTALALAIDGTVILLAHPSQAGKALGTGESGSTAWSNSVRSRLYLSRPTAEKGEPEDKDARVLSRQKSNYAQMALSSQRAMCLRKKMLGPWSERKRPRPHSLPDLKTLPTRISAATRIRGKPTMRQRASRKKHLVLPS